MQERSFVSISRLETDSPENQDLSCLRIRDIWAYFKSQDILFWLINFYLFLEYVRPQTLYPVLDVMPYNMIVILLTLFLLITRKGFKLTANVENRLLFCFSMVVVLSSIFAISPEIAFGKLSIFISWVLIYFLIINIVNTQNRFLVFMLMFLLYNFKMSQHALRGWAAIGFGFGKDGTGGGPGWFANSGEFGIEMCVFFPLASYFVMALKDKWPKWKQYIFMLMPLTALTGMISSSSRGAVVGGLATITWFLMKSRRKLLAAFIVVILCFTAYALIPDEQKTRFDKAGTDSTSLNRTERWEKGMKMASMYPVLGVGYGNWALADVKFFSGNGALCHNVFVECLSELGYSGLVIFVLMVLFILVNNSRSRKILLANKMEHGFLYSMSHGLDGALVGFLVSGFFITVLFYPYFWIILTMTVALNNIVNKLQLTAL